MQKVRLLLLPFSWIYGIITFVRNLFFDSGIFSTYIIPKKSICVGNLSVGGTGKTPHVAYLAQLLKNETKLSILSRGYGRKSKGFVLATSTTKVSEIGDEPMLYFKRFNSTLNVTVCERRKTGIENILELFPKNEIILLDDAFQHRAVKAGLNLLLTDFNSLFSKDFVLPAGNLREFRLGKKRADIIIVTKSPAELNQETKSKICNELGFPSEKVFFSSIKYGDLIPFSENPPETLENVLLITGIANPTPLYNYLNNKYKVELLSFSDHHEFTLEDIKLIQQKFDTFAQQNKAIITTEKDYVRLENSLHKDIILRLPWYYQSIDVEIDKKEVFNNFIKAYVNTI